MRGEREHLGALLTRLPDLWAFVRPGWAAAVGSDPKRRLALLVLSSLSICGILVFVLGFDGEQALEWLQRHHLTILGFVGNAPVLAGFAFVAIYALAVATSLPAVGVLTMVGGYLFGWLPGSLYVLVASTMAGALVFLLARRALRGSAPASLMPSLRRFGDGFRRNAATFVFLLHLMPIFPYAMVIGLPAACGVRLRIYVVSALLGLIPGTVLFARLGAGLGKVLDRGVALRPSDFLTTEIVLSLAGLGLLALLPVIYHGYQSWRADH